MININIYPNSKKYIINHSQSESENRCHCACCEMAYYITGMSNAGWDGCAAVYVPCETENSIEHRFIHN